MEIRNPVYNAFGTIDCEINHPQYGWIPFTAAQEDRPDIFDAALAMGPAAYVSPPDPTPEEALAAERAAMRCRAAAMRLVLLDVGKLDAVQAVADSDPRASIVWEYEPEYTRNDMFVNALGVDLFTPEEIDDLFRAAMQR